MTTIPAGSHLRAVLFDLGETLLDAGGRTPLFRDQAEQDFQAVFAYLQAQGQALPPWPTFFDYLLQRYNQWRQDSYQSLKSIHIAELLQQACARWGIELGPTQLQETISLTYRYSDETARLYPDALATMDTLRSQELQLGLISNTIWPGWCHEPTMARLGISSRVPHRFYSADQPFRKPHPQIFATALAALGVAAEQAVYVGDHLDPDIRGAHAAGMQAMLLRMPYRTERHPHIAADATIDALSDLPNALAKLFSQGGCS